MKKRAINMQNVNYYVGHMTIKCTIMDVVVKYLRGKKNKKTAYYLVNYVQIYKQDWLPCELCSFENRSGNKIRMTDCAMQNHSGSPLK